MTDYTWPSVYFAYLFFFIRSWKDGYWSKQSEDIKYQVFEDSPRSGPRREEHMHVPR